MEPLVTSRRVMTWLCTHPADAATSKKERILYVVCTLASGTTTFLALLAGVAFIVLYLPVDLEICLYAVFQVASQIAVLNAMIIAVFNQQRIATIFTKLSQIYAASEWRIS